MMRRISFVRACVFVRAFASPRHLDGIIGIGIIVIDASSHDSDGVLERAWDEWTSSVDVDGVRARATERGDAAG